MTSQILSGPESKFVIEQCGQEEKARNMYHLFVLKAKVSLHTPEQENEKTLSLKFR